MIKKLLQTNTSLVLLLLFVFGQVQATESGTVSVITKSGGELKANVSVVVRSWSTPAFEVMVKTNVSGQAVVNNVPLGDLDVFALNDNGDVVSKFKGELLNINETVSVALDM